MSWKQDVLELVQTSPANVTLLLADADSGKELLSFNRDRRFVSASTIKTAILLCALEGVQDGELDLDAPVFVPQEEILSDSAVFERGEQEMPLRDLLRWMIIVSDNTATNALIRLLTMERINDFCARMGWKDSKVERLMLDFDAVKAGKNNYTSALDQFGMFRAIYQKSILTLELCDLAMDMLLGQRDCSDFLRYIPGPVRVAHKTGGLDFLEHDSGLFFLEKATLYLGVFVTDAPDDAHGSRLIAAAARRIYDQFR